MTRAQHTLNHNYSQAPHPQTHNTPYHLSLRTTPIQHYIKQHWQYVENDPVLSQIWPN